MGVSPLSIDEDAGGEPVQREHGRLTLQAEWEGSPPSEWRASQLPTDLIGVMAKSLKRYH